MSSLIGEKISTKKKIFKFDDLFWILVVILFDWVFFFPSFIDFFLFEFERNRYMVVSYLGGEKNVRNEIFYFFNYGLFCMDMCHV